MEERELLEVSEAAYCGLKKIQSMIPEVEKQMEEAKNNLKEVHKEVKNAMKLVQSTEAMDKELDDKIAKAKEEMDKSFDVLDKVRQGILDKLEEAQNKAADTAERLEEIVAATENHVELVETVRDLTNRMETLEKWVAESKATAEKTEKQEKSVVNVAVSVPDQSKQEQPVVQLVRPARRTFVSIRELKRTDKEKCLLVERKNWRNDYCFCVERIENGIAYGTCFLDGEKQGGNSWYSATIEEFCPYYGPSRAKIYAQYE